MLAHRVCYGFCLYLFFSSGDMLQTLIRHLSLRINSMHLLVSHFMNCGFHRLDLAHSFQNRNPFLYLMVISLGSTADFFKFHWNRTGSLKRLKEHLILFHITSQFIDSQGWQFLSFCLADIKDRNHFKSRTQHFLYFFLMRAIRIHQDFACDGICLIYFHLLLIRCWRKNTDSLFSSVHLAAKLILPGGVTGNQSRIWLLHSNQQRII